MGQGHIMFDQGFEVGLALRSRDVFAREGPSLVEGRCFIPAWLTNVCCACSLCFMQHAFIELTSRSEHGFVKSELV